jgi:hypothetical protein
MAMLGRLLPNVVLITVSMVMMVMSAFLLCDDIVSRTVELVGVCAI